MCSPKVASIILIAINVIFFLLGIGLIIPGILLLINNDVINDNILPLFQQVSLGSSNFGDLAKSLPIALICLGTFVLIISVVGLLGACCCKIRCFLMVYAIIVILLLIGKIVVLALWYFMNDKFISTIKGELKTNLETKYTNDDLTSDQTSTSWNYLFLTFECCGVNAVSSSTNDFDNSPWQTGSPSYDIPYGCCPGVTSSNYTLTAATNPLCPVTPVGQYAKGCYDAVYDFIKGYSLWFYIGGPMIFLVEIIGIICAIYLFCKHEKDD